MKNAECRMEAAGIAHQGREGNEAGKAEGLTGGKGANGGRKGAEFWPQVSAGLASQISQMGPRSLIVFQPRQATGNRTPSSRGSRKKCLKPFSTRTGR
jgi:hypothetical protein